MSKKTYPELTPEQLAALREFKTEHEAQPVPTGWKWSLSVQWQRASAPPILHALRNSHGTGWLADFEFPEDRIDPGKVYGGSIDGRTRIIVRAKTKKAAMAAFNEAGFRVTEHAWRHDFGESGNDLEEQLTKRAGVVFQSRNSTASRREDWTLVYSPETEAEKAERETREVEMFGCAEHVLVEFVEDYVGNGKLFATRKDAAFSLLSDAQEEIALNLGEKARKTINRVKWLLEA